MNYFLLLVVLIVCGGAYYEFTLQETDAVENQQQISELEVKMTKLITENHELADEKVKLTASLADTQAKVADLTSQVQASQQSAAAAHPDTLTPPSAPPPPNSNIGTITTLDGRTFPNCQLIKAEADGITFKNASGTTKVLFSSLPPDIQKKFGYDPAAAHGG